MLQKIFGESDEEEEEEDRSAMDTAPKTKKLTKRRREEGSLSPREMTSTPPLQTLLPRPLSPPMKPMHVAPPTLTPPKEEPRKPMFKPRGEGEEERVLSQLTEGALDKEDLAMLRLALGRMGEEGVGLVGGVNWAYHPCDILSISIVSVFFVQILPFFFFLTPPTSPRSPAHQAKTAGPSGAAGAHDRLREVRGLLQDRPQRQGQVPPSSPEEAET